jgi:tetratricopeptide (TPR) repeat protein
MPRPLNIAKRKLTAPVKLTQQQNQTNLLIQQGLSFHKQGKFKEAQAIYENILTAHPNHFDALQLLGALLTDTNQFTTAVDLLTRAIKLNPNVAVIHSNCGNALFKLKRYDETIASCDKAISIDPNIAEAHSNLGNALHELGHIEQALEKYSKALQIKPDFAGTLFSLSLALNDQNNLDEEILYLEKLIFLYPEYFGLKASVKLAILKFLLDDIESSKELLVSSQDILKIQDVDFKNEIIYWNYLSRIISFHEVNLPLEISKAIVKNLYIIGESHALTSHGIYFPTIRGNYLCKAKLIMGCQQWHLGNYSSNRYKYKFEAILESLPRSSEILFAIGEIDCRYDVGIMKHSEKHPRKLITEIIGQTITGFLEFIDKLLNGKAKSIIIQGVPYPKITFPIDDPRRDKHLQLVHDFNVLLMEKSRNLGFGFLDVYTMTKPNNLHTNELWHIDDVHLRPDYIIEAFKNHLTYSEKKSHRSPWVVVNPDN